MTLKTRPPRTWRPIPGFEEYEACTDGRIRRNGRVLKTFEMKSGHHAITLCVGGKKYQRLVHRLILETFRGSCPDGMEGLHNDGRPSNNWVGNLRWGTRSENVLDAIRHGTFNNGHMRKTHCPQGHPYDDSNTYRANGRRFCRACRRAATRRWAERR
ncbi:HNH endonuclease [Mycobacterium phage Maravista]|nr:HNH endonuclease [Mycobacterium phage Pippy]